MIEHPIVPFNPNHPKNNASEEVPLNCLLSNFLRNSFFQKGLLPIKTIIVVCPNPAKLTHDEGDPPPSMPRLDAIPKLVFYQLAN